MKFPAFVLTAALMAAFGAQAAEPVVAGGAPDQHERVERREGLRNDIKAIADLRADREEARRLERDARKRGDVAEATKQLQREMADTAKIREEKRKLEEQRQAHRQEPGHEHRRGEYAARDNFGPRPAAGVPNAANQMPSMGTALAAPSQGAGFPPPPHR